MDLAQWLQEDWAGTLPSEGELAEGGKKALARFRLTFKTGELTDLIRQVSHEYDQLDKTREKLKIRGFFDRADRAVRGQLEAAEDLCLTFLTEYAGFFAAVSETSKGGRASSPLGPAFPGRAEGLSRAYKKDLLPLLRQERLLVREQLKALDAISLSPAGPGLVKGEARRLLQSPSRDRRMRAYYSLTSLLAGHREEAEGRFIEMHEARRLMASQAGFDSFYDYVLARAGLTPDSRIPIQAFRQLVQTHLVPLTRHIRDLQWGRLGLTDPRPWDLMYPAAFGLPQLDASAFPLEETYLKALRYIFTAKLPLFEEMKAGGALSFQVLGDPGLGTGDRLPGMLSAYFPEDERSFLLLSSIPQERFASLAFSETGSLLYSHSRAERQPCPLPLAEAPAIRPVVRHSMAFLSQRVWALFYGNMTRYAREYDLTERTLNLPVYCALDEMEEFLCRARVTNLTIFRHAWQEIAERYQLPGVSADYPGLIPLEDLWLCSPILWSRPLTGIFDVLAVVSVLGTLPLGRQHQSLEEYFTRLLNNEELADPLVRLADAGYPSPFEEETVRKAVFAIVDFLGL